MKILSFKSIQSRLTFWFLFLALTPLLTGILITYNQQKHSINQESFNKLSAIRDLKVQQLDHWFSERQGDLKSISEDYEIRCLENIFEKKSKSAEDIEKLETARKLLSRYSKHLNDYNEIFFINTISGTVELSSRMAYEGTNKSIEPYFSVPLETGEIYMEDIYYSELLDKPEMIISIPVFCLEHNTHIIGIVVARISLNKSLYPLLQNRVGLGNTGETLIVNKDVVALNRLRYYDNAPLNLKISAEPAVRAANGETGILITTDYRGEDVLAAFTSFSETGWGFITKQDMSEVNEPVHIQAKNLAFLFAISALLISLIVFWIARKISEPIVDMSTVAETIKKGDYSVRNIVNSNDELGTLAIAVNEMTSSIESRNIIQKGIADISDKMIKQSSLQQFSSEIIKQLMEITGANMSIFYVLNEGTMQYEHFASVGANEELLKAFNANNPEGELGNAIAEKNIFYLRNIPDTTLFKFKTSAGDAIPREIITIPILVDNTVVAIISLVNIQNFRKETYDILKLSWAGINTSYSNLMVGERTRIFAESLTRSNQKLEALSEELQEQSEELKRSSDELQEQNLELETQRNQVEEANRLKSEFLSNMSHELRTPLNSINALSQVLITQAKSKLDDDENNYLEIIERNGKRLLSLINSILDLSKIEAGKMDIMPQAVSVNSLLTIIKENMQALTESSSISFNLNVDENLPHVETDEARIHQVLLNIISNAVKFTEKGSVTVSAKQDKENVIIAVKDTGIGISAEMLPHIFDEFRQLDGSSSRQYEGTGLGLAIAYKLIKVLGGNISVKSKLNEGTVFTITVPVKWQREFKPEDAIVLGTFHPKTSKKTILVVDDDPEIVSNISKYFHKSDYNTISASSGKEALILAEKHQPFAITLDIIMPEMDGWEVLQKLKDNPETKNIPVIVVSGSDDRDTGYALGAVGYINKPVNKKLLISEIKKLNRAPESVMIVDDNEFELKQMAEIIEEENINTILANSGEDCIKKLKEKVPDILVLDLLMPGMDGFQVLERIRGIPETKNLPVIIVTAKNITDREKKQLRGKVSSLIEKSDTTPRDLYQEINRILSELEEIEQALISNKNVDEKRILLVEDNLDAIVQMKTILEGENYVVDVATGGQEALDYIQHTFPDGIILDLMMPEVDGFEVLEKIRSTEATKNIPVLILTAKDLTKKDLSKLNANNIQQLIHKGDIDVESLILKVELMLVGLENEKTGGDEREVKIENRGIKEKEIKIIKRQTKKAGDLADILIVEDNMDNMTTIKAILKGKYNINEAFDGKEGLDLAQSQLPDLILLDMSLPKMAGEEVIHILKTNKETEKIPVIAVTAQAMKGDKEKIMKAGCDGYISKPVDRGELMREIGRFLSV
ncbi:MAG: response regulator [Bacteroidales bacterium]|nr:response regulator [Bacteroidales bacterium]